jgi:hypothetical protein
MANVPESVVHEEITKGEYFYLITYANNGLKGAFQILKTGISAKP